MNVFGKECSTFTPSIIERNLIRRVDLDLERERERESCKAGEKSY